MEERPKRRHISARKRRRNRTKTGFAVFYIITLLIGVVACVALFYFAVQHLVPQLVTGGNPIANITDDRDNDESHDPDADFELNTAIGMITAMNTFEPRTLNLMLLDTGRTERFNLNPDTTVRNRQGATVSFSEISVGQIVEIEFESEDRYLTIVALTDRAWERQQDGGVTVDINAGTITINNQTYTFSNRTMVIGPEGSLGFAQINPDDLLTIVGYGSEIWSVRIDTTHGFIEFENAEHIIDGTVAIGTILFTELDVDTPLSVAEGTHRLIIEGQNIERFIRYVVVRPGHTAVIDLAEAESRRGTLQVITNATQPTVYINGAMVHLDNTLIDLEFGEHIIRLEQVGFISAEREFVLNQSILRLEINLEHDTPRRSILVETSPTNAQVFLDGVFVGNSPVTVHAEFGNRTIIARMEGFTDRPLHFIADHNSPAQYFLPLDPIVAAQPDPSPAPPEEPIDLEED